MDSTESLGARVRRLREGLGLSQGKLATHSGLSLKMIKDIENDRRGGSVDTLAKLSKVFGVTIQEIATGDSTVEANVLSERIDFRKIGKMISSIPSDIYEMASHYSPDDPVWEGIRGLFDAANEVRAEKAAKKKNA